MQTVHSASPAASMLSIDRSFRIRGWPDSAEAMFGWSLDEALGQDLFALLGCSSGGTEPVRAWIPCRFLAQKRTRHGDVLNVQVGFELMRGSAGEPVGVMTLERVEEPAEPPLSESEARYQSVVAAMQEGVVVQDLQGRILACNEAAQQILGLSLEQLRGRSSVDPRWRAVHPDGSRFPGEEHPAMVTLRTGQPQSGVVMGVHKPDGSLTWISVNSRPIRTDASKPHHAVVATFADITEERRLAAEREREQRRVQESLAQNEALVAELRLALDSVRTLAGLLPVCAWCKSVRDDQGYWQQLEVYLSEHTDAQLTHGLCPSCSVKLTKG